jgi:hypothetical protein
VIVGVFAAVGVLILFLSVVPDKYSPIPVCQISPMRHFSSPGKSLVAWYVRTNCESGGELESQIWLGDSDKQASGQSVFSAPAHYRDRMSAATTRSIFMWPGKARIA